MSHPFLPDPGHPVILASGSPRRAQILNQHGLEFRIEPSGVSETERAGESPDAHVLRLAREKASAVAERNPEALCVGCDTVVVLGEEILGKPADAAQARAMLRELAEREHRVFSSVALAHRGREHLSAAHQVTRVHFRALRDEEIEDYVRTGEPMDKAGAYGIQGYGAMLVDSIQGCYFNVMGLPLEAMRRLWNEFVREAGQET